MLPYGFQRAAPSDTARPVPMRGMSTSGIVATVEAVELFSVAAKTCAVMPTRGSHCERGTSAASRAPLTRARAARMAG